MHTVTLNIKDSIYNHIMFLLKSLNPKDIEIINDELSLTNNRQNINYENWTQEEMVNIGKIGLTSSSFIEDKEDYSKW
jgi:hypothetical protein